MLPEIFEKPIETNGRQAAFKVSGNYDTKELKYFMKSLNSYSIKYSSLIK